MRSDWMDGCKERCGEFYCMLWDIDGRRRQLRISSPLGPVSRLNYSTTYDTRTKTDANNIIYSSVVKSPITRSFSFGRLLYVIERRLNWRKARPGARDHKLGPRWEITKDGLRGIGQSY